MGNHLRDIIINGFKGLLRTLIFVRRFALHPTYYISLLLLGLRLLLRVRTRKRLTLFGFLVFFSASPLGLREGRGNGRFNAAARTQGIPDRGLPFLAVLREFLRSYRIGTNLLRVVLILQSVFH